MNGSMPLVVDTFALQTFSKINLIIIIHQTVAPTEPNPCLNVLQDNLKVSSFRVESENILKKLIMAVASIIKCG